MVGLESGRPDHGDPGGAKATEPKDDEDAPPFDPDLDLMVALEGRRPEHDEKPS